MVSPARGIGAVAFFEDEIDDVTSRSFFAISGSLAVDMVVTGCRRRASRGVTRCDSRCAGGHVVAGQSSTAKRGNPEIVESSSYLSFSKSGGAKK